MVDKTPQQRARARSSCASSPLICAAEASTAEERVRTSSQRKGLRRRKKVPGWHSVGICSSATGPGAGAGNEGCGCCCTAACGGDGTAKEEGGSRGDASTC